MVEEGLAGEVEKVESLKVDRDAMHSRYIQIRLVDEHGENHEGLEQSEGAEHEGQALEIPVSPVIKQLKTKVESAPDAEETKEMCKLLFDTALLTSGFSIDHPVEFAERVFKLMTQEANLESEKKRE